MKTCSRCKIEKSVSEFHKDKNKKDGLNNICKMCAIEKGKKYRQANPEKVRDGVNRWRQANPEKVRDGVNRWQQANPEKVRESSKRWRQANPEKVIESIKRWQQANPEKMREISKIRWAIKKQSGL